MKSPTKITTARWAVLGQRIGHVLWLLVTALQLARLPIQGAEPTPGALRRYVYSGISGTRVADLVNHSRFPSAPSLTALVTSFEAPRDFGENYGQALVGYIVPPVTGDYRFYVAGDDNCELYLSSDENPANLKLIASEPEWNNYRDWTGTTRRPNQENISPPIPLTAGGRYFVVGLMKEGDQGDHFGVAWQPPGATKPAAGSNSIPGSALAYRDDLDLGTALSVLDGCSLADDDWLGRMSLLNNIASDSKTQMSDSGATCFLRLTTSGGRAPHEPQLLAAWTDVVQKGDLLAGSIRLRRKPGSPAGKAQVVFQRNGFSDGGSYSPTTIVELAATDTWQVHEFAFRAGTNFNGTSGNPAQFALNFGFGNQAVDVSDLRLQNFGQTQPNTPAHRILGGFRHGMNLGNSLEYDTCPPSNRFEAADFKAIRDEGFDHVRLPVAWHQGNGPAPGYQIADCRFEWADGMVTNALAAGLGVVVDLHHFDDFKMAPAGQRDRFVNLWRQVAQHYAAMPTNVIFELLNEPFELPADTDADLNQSYAGALAAIRSTGGNNATRLVLLSPAERRFLKPDESHWQRLATLSFPADDPYVAATVHNYDPYLFTHQGAAFTRSTDILTTNVLFPGPPLAPLTRDPRANAAWVVDWFSRYNNRANTGYNNPSSGRDIQFFADTVLAWALPAGRAVYVGEFGAYEAADPQSRVNYARTAREIFEAAGLGWAWWNWNSDFHYIRHEGGVFQPNPPGLRAALLPGSPAGTNVSPAIFAQPQSTNLNAGSSVTLRVDADGSGPLRFQWRRNGAPLTGATQPALALKNLTLSVAGSYTVVVSNGAGSVTSAAALLTVVVPPAITIQPLSQSKVEGTTVTFSVAANGTAPLSYRWKKGDVDIAGATADSFTVNSISPADAGLYSVMVSNAAGSATSVSATLTVLELPAITSQPASATRNQGQSHTFEVSASGTPPLAYQWFKGTEPIDGATSANHSLPSVTTADAGSYTVVVSNGAGSVTSAAALLIVIVPPAITSQPLGVNLDQGATGHFTVEASGSAPVSYQWKKGADLLPGRTSATLELANVQPADAGSYSVVVSNAAGSVTSAAAVLSVKKAAQTLTWDALTNNTVLLLGQAYPLTATASSGLPVFFRVQSGPAVIAGGTVTATNLGPVVLVAEQAGDDRYLAAAVERTVTVSLPGEVTGEPPVLVSGPTNVSAVLGRAVEFRAVFSGTAPMSYQWYLNGVAIGGETNAVLRIPVVRLEHGGSYTVTAANEAGSAESGPARLDFELPRLALVDRFADRQVFTDGSFAGVTNNLTATGEAGEPKHAGKAGGKSMWLTWRAPGSGVATFRTVGSSYDTLLAVYTGTALGNLVEVASDEDRGGFLTSEVKFNAVGGTDYHIAVDGFAGASGQLVLSWELQLAAPVLPTITGQPKDTLVPVGQPVAFQVTAGPVGVSYQWSFNGQPLVGATAATLALPAVTTAQAGNYRVRVATPGGAAVDSRDALLELTADAVPVADAFSAEKLADLFADDGVGGGAAPAGLRRPTGFTSVSVGVQGTRFLNLTDAATEPGDPVPCDILIEGSRWLRFRTTAPLRNFTLATVDAGFDTVLAVFTNRFAPVAIVCNDDVSPARNTSRVVFDAVPDVDYLVMVAAKRGGAGVCGLSWVAPTGQLVAESLSVKRSALEDGRFIFRAVVPAGTYQLGRGNALDDLRPILRPKVRSGLFEFADPDPIAPTARFYQLRPTTN